MLDNTQVDNNINAQEIWRWRGTGGESERGREREKETERERERERATEMSTGSANGALIWHAQVSRTQSADNLLQIPVPTNRHSAN